MTSIVTETDVEKMQKKMAKQHAHELRTLEQKKKKQAKAIKDKAKRMELYKMFSAEEEKLKARHVAEMTELLSGASIAEKEIAEHDEVVATNSSETGEEAKIRKKKEKAAKKRQAKLEKEKAETEKLQAELGAAQHARDTHVKSVQQHRARCKTLAAALAADKVALAQAEEAVAGELGSL